MKRKRVIAELIDPGGCRHYRAGQRFVLNGFKPVGFCETGYSATSRAAKTLLYGTSPAGDGKVLVRCPRPNGAVWEVRLEEVAESQ